MRGTTKISNQNALYYINKNFNSLNRVTNQISLQQQVIDIEDDPLSANIGMRMLNVIGRSEQYNRNIKAGVGSLNLLDGKLASSKTVMDKIRTLVLDGASDPETAVSYSAKATEINELLKQLVTTGNAKDGTRYLFGGQNTTTPPFTIVNGRYVHYSGNNLPINIVADNGTTVPINSTGTDVYGNMTTTISTGNLNPDINLNTDNSTRLSDLNAGQGVPKGKIMVYYSSYPQGLEVDLSRCDTMEDVKDAIEKATLEASRNLNTNEHPWLDSSNMDWHDLQDRYVKVTMNPDHNGISLQEMDLGEPLPEPTVYEQRRGVSYSGRPGYAGPGDLGVAANEGEETTVYDKSDYIYGTGAAAYAPLRVDNFASNKVADALGIRGTANRYNPASPDKALDGFLHGGDLDPRLSDSTLLADIEGYNDSVYTITNGAKPDNPVVIETSNDAGNVFSEYNLSGLSLKNNTGSNGELYIRAVNRGTADEPELYVEVFTVPVDKATEADRVATGVYNKSRTGGTVILEECNNSGLSGSIGVLLPDSFKEAAVSVKVDLGESLSDVVHVPAFVEENNANGAPKDSFGIASGWNIRGLDKPPAMNYDKNHPASTDLDGNVSANYRYDASTKSFIVELSRPSFGGEPAKVIATGSIYVGDDNGPPLSNAVSGRVELVGAPGFEGVNGSVYLELPAGADFSSASDVMGSNADNPTSVTYPLQSDAPAGTIVFGGATELVADQNISGAGFHLKGDTLFKKGQVFNNDIHLSSGGIIYAGTPIDRDITLGKGTYVEANTLKQGAILAKGQGNIEFTDGLAAGTVIPRGSYYNPALPSGDGFPADGMGMSVTQLNPYTGASTTTGVSPIGFDVRATFATVEDLNRAIEEKGIYVTSHVSDDGKAIEFRSSLAGAYLTVSQDSDCYEQMGDKFQQLTGLDLNGLVKGVNSDKNGNVYTEVVYYPPDPQHPDHKIALTSQDGTIIEVDPGYYVRVYSDQDQMTKPYAERDNTKLVAEGFVPAGEWNMNYDPQAPYDPDPNSAGYNVPYLPKSPVTITGLMHDMKLEERNGSGVSGTVSLDYYGDREPMRMVPNANGVMEPDYDPYNNDQITVFPGGLRPNGSIHTTIQEWDIKNPTPGRNCDYAGVIHAEVTGDSSSLFGVDVRLYKDSSHTAMTSRTDPAEAPVDGKVTLYEVDKHGNFALDAKGNRIVAGSMAVTRNDLADGQTDSFKITTGGIRNGGQEREENVFATINDIIDAINAQDAAKLHDMVGSVEKDIDRVLAARTDAGARNNRLTLLSERHADDILKYTATLTSRVGMDDQALAMAVLGYQAATKAYQAAMQVSASALQLTLLNYL